MISRDTAAKALKQLEYERHSIAPSISGYYNGNIMTVYFAAGIKKAYAYGDYKNIHGYIAPKAMINNHEAIKKMIGYSGSIVVIDSEGRHV